MADAFSNSEKTAYTVIKSLIDRKQSIKGIMLCGPLGSGKSFVIKKIIDYCKNNSVKLYKLTSFKPGNADEVVDAVKNERAFSVMILPRVEDGKESEELLAFINKNMSDSPVMMISECRSFDEVSPALSAYFIPVMMKNPSAEDVYEFLKSTCNISKKSTAESLYNDKNINNYFALCSISVVYNAVGDVLDINEYADAFRVVNIQPAFSIQPAVNIQPAVQTAAADNNVASNEHTDRIVDTQREPEIAPETEFDINSSNHSERFREAEKIEDNLAELSNIFE